MLALVMERVLVGLGLLAAYAVFVAAVPKWNCRKCNGWGSRKKGRRRRRSACGKCGATGRAFRPGARIVHRGIVLVADTMRDRAKQRQEAD